MNSALKLNGVLSYYQDETYSSFDLEDLEMGCYIPSWVEKAPSITPMIGKEPKLYLGEDGAKIQAPNGRAALALMMVHHYLIEHNGLSPSKETAESLSKKLVMYEGIMRFGTQEQQNAMWEAYCYLFSYAKAETDIDKFHLHCVEVRGFVFKPSPNSISTRHFPKPGEKVKLVRFESKVRRHGWMTPEMFRMPETGQLCRAWREDGFDAKHWFLLSWLEAHGICHEKVSCENGVEYLEREITVPEDTDEYFCDGEQYVERIPK